MKKVLWELAMDSAIDMEPDFFVWPDSDVFVAESSDEVLLDEPVFWGCMWVCVCVCFLIYKNI